MNRINNIKNEEIENSNKVTESQSHFDEEWYKDLMIEVEKEKIKEKRMDKKKVLELMRIFLWNKSYKNIAIWEYEKLLKTKPEQINLTEVIEDLNEWKWFRGVISKKLQSNLIDSISPDDIYREFSSGLKEMPFMTKVLSISDFKDKKNLLEETIQKNNEIADEYFNEKELDELSNTLGEESINYVLNDEILSWLVKWWKNLGTPHRLYIADKIVKNLSTKFWINAPYVTNINFWEQDLTMWSKWIINLNLNSSFFNNFHDFLAVLVHEFTHCLQDNYKTPWWEEGIKKAKEYYCNWITWDSRLDNLGKEAHDSSLLEKEACYVQRKIWENALKINF